MAGARWARWAAIASAFALASTPNHARAQVSEPVDAPAGAIQRPIEAQKPAETPPKPGEQDRDIPQIGPPPTAGWQKQRIVRVEVRPILGDTWFKPAGITSVREGQRFSPAAARAAMSELTQTGQYASVRAEIEATPGGVVLRLLVVPRRLVEAVRLVGGVFGEEETMEAVGLSLPADITRAGLRKLESDVTRFYVGRGYPNAQVLAEAIDTDNPMDVILLFQIDPGSPTLIDRVRFEVSPRLSPALERQLTEYAASVADRADQIVFDTADQEFTALLQERGWHDAAVAHEVQRAQGETVLVVDVNAGPHYRVRFEGTRSFDGDQLRSFLELDEALDRSPETIERRLREFYVARGFFDVTIKFERRGAGDASDVDLVFLIRENPRLRVVAREFPCLSGERSPDDVGQEIDGVLGESLPGTELLAPPHPDVLNQSISPSVARGARPTPVMLNPWNTYSPSVYAKALEHVEKLYRSEGYLSASVGPAVVLRRQCDPRSPVGACIPLGKHHRPKSHCPTATGELPEPDPAPSTDVTCQTNAARGIRCETDVVLHIPVKLGPQTFLWDVEFEGNQELVAAQLTEVAELELERPVSQFELENARQRILEAYAEEGFAFANADIELELSEDHSRGKLRFIISERERVRVSNIVVRGARRTRESLILSRVALEIGGYYRSSLVRKTEERLATLAVFSSIRVDLEDPEVPARNKVVVITLQERPSQSVDTLAGFSTGEGIRVGFIYGHRNLAQRAIQFTLQVQGGFLPSVMILDPDVREKFDALQRRRGLISRLERRITATVGFPEVGLGPLYRLNIEGVDVRDLARDYGLTRDAAIFTLSYRPNTRFTIQFGPSFELNDAEILSEDRLVEYLQNNPGNAALRRLLNVPEGKTFAIAQNLGMTWDRRDNPLGATQGTFLAAGVEHVNGFPAEDNPENLTSHFMRYTSRVAGYIRLTEKGTALAASFGWGVNQQLAQDSQTYPDRLFFLGGIDSLRGFLQDSVIPEDLAQRILNPDDPDDPLTEREVTIRGGDVMINPRLELRLPITGVFQTALFADAGNLWFDAGSFNPTRLRYTAGTGLRITTPLGPLVADYGINLDRRPWEDRGAFHLTLGLF